MSKITLDFEDDGASFRIRRQRDLTQTEARKTRGERLAIGWLRLSLGLVGACILFAFAVAAFFLVIAAN